MAGISELKASVSGLLTHLEQLALREVKVLEEHDYQADLSHLVDAVEKIKDDVTKLVAPPAPKSRRRPAATSESAAPG